MHRAARSLTAIAFAFAASLPAGANGAAQQVNDVEMRGRIHGVRPPAGYHRVLASDPGAYQFERVWKEAARRVRQRRQALRASGDLSALNAHFEAAGPAGPSASVAQAAGTAVTGTFRIPVLIGLFADSTHVFQPARTELDSVLFHVTAPPYSAHSFYDEVTNGLVRVVGDVIDWFTVDSASTWYEGSSNGLSPSTDYTGDFIRELLDAADPFVDFSSYDNDGDGYVDLIAVLHPLKGGECGGSHIWSHRWVYRAWKGSAYTTNDGGVRVEDYIIQPAVGGSSACDSTRIMPIGTLVHELGHGIADFPDLYNTLRGQPGVGSWDLMATGNYRTPASPAHPGAWTKDDAGWIAIDTIADGAGTGSRTLRSVLVSDTALWIAVPGTNEFFLLENRRREGSDVGLRQEGLLIWHVDPDSISARRWFNRVNARLPFGVALEQADGFTHLEDGRNAGDPGDPFPGNTTNTHFGTATDPASDRNDGSYTGLRVDSITVNPDGSLGFRLSFDAQTAVTATTTAPRNGVMGTDYADTLDASGGSGTYTWSLVSGALPPGLDLAASGVISGVPESDGSYSFVARVTSGGTTDEDTLTIAVVQPSVSLQDVVDHLLGRAVTLNADELRYLDLLGNDSGSFDVGDFRAFLQETGVIASAAARFKQAAVNSGPGSNAGSTARGPEEGS